MTSINYAVNYFYKYKNFLLLVLLMCVCAQLCLTLCNPMDCSPPGSSVHGISQARILEWISIFPSGDLLDPGIEPVSLVSSALTGRFFITVPPEKP